MEVLLHVVGGEASVSGVWVVVILRKPVTKWNKIFKE